MKKYLLGVILLLNVMFLSAQESQPKLVVGIVVDQMRYDYLTRFQDKYVDGGFNRLLNEGFNCKNNHYNYVPTYTGPGHASIFTGTSPMNHGIISNTWYDKFSDKYVYCASDESVKSVGVNTEKEQMSPNRMKTTSVADQLRLHTQMKSKVIGIALKDRGAILPAGHSASAAYWFRGREDGKWITSTHYMNELPKWVTKFNKNADQYLKQWNTLQPIKEYIESGSDENHFEGAFKGKENVSFPYDLKQLSKVKGNKGYDVIKASAIGNEMTTDFAIEAIKNEQLGQNSVTDFLTLSYSSTDYVGHQFGVNSVEVQDTYLRLDRDLSRLFHFLDSDLGKGNYTVFLTADHGAVQVPNYLKSLKIPAGYFRKDDFKKQLKEALKKKYQTTGLIKNVSNNQVFLNKEKIRMIDEDLDDVQEFIAQTIIDFKHIDKVFTADALMNTSFTTGIGKLIQNGFHPKHSGDVVFVLEPSVISYPETGSTHGSGNSYDTHVPLLFYGNGIKKGETYQKTEIIDVAPTISALLGISFPNGCSGKPLGFVFK
ncbi:alkaline phosphatase PafA [Pseudofulvibacter geojedonensis]|uniref:Alkaline phosphatase PafA n=1 Tax=Pseudofulvibacter geojedonensis TaxID=1123758 RepID=A0ABW3I4E1_9FLAO